MRSHDQIITEAGGYKALAGKIGEPESRVRFWVRRQSIPPEAWLKIAKAEAASLEELAAAAEARAANRPAHQDGAAA